jgi:hypothetical protein
MKSHTKALSHEGRKARGRIVTLRAKIAALDREMIRLCRGICDTALPREMARMKQLPEHRHDL